MKIKIEKVLKAHEPFSGVSKTSGKPYKIFAYECKGGIDGVAADLFTVKTMSEQQANALQAGGEFDAEPSVYKGETTYMVKGAYASSNGGGWKGKSNYTPRVYISGKNYHDLCVWCYKIAKEIDPEHAPVLFDKILGTASVLLDMSKYAAKQSPSATPIKTATAADVQKADSDPHAVLTDELPAATMNSKPIEEEVPF